MRTETEASTTESVHAPPWATSVATFCGIGRLRPGPGTWASLFATVIWFAAAEWIPAGSQPLILGGLIVLAVGFGIPAASVVARAFKSKDPQFVVIDEVGGQWIALLFVPVTWKTALASFILFRGFDIVKPPPLRRLERLPTGTGIVLDDVGAGIYALIAVQLLMYFRLLSH